MLLLTQSEKESSMVEVVRSSARGGGVYASGEPTDMWLSWRRWSPRKGCADSCFKRAGEGRSICISVIEIREVRWTAWGCDGQEYLSCLAVSSFRITRMLSKASQ